jgi:hypothetical protein
LYIILMCVAVLTVDGEIFYSLRSEITVGNFVLA